MKASHAIAMTVVAVLITAAIQETRIASLRSNPSAPAPPREISRQTTIDKVEETDRQDNGRDTAPGRTKKHEPSSIATATESEETAEPDEPLSKTVRKMWENPAGKSIMNQGVKMAVAMMYEDFMLGLELSKEENDYFKELLGKEMSAQQEIGMKMLGAGPDERKALADEMGRRSKETEEEIRKFLNNDEDFKNYTEYKNRLPEHQQLDGIRATMSGKGVPLDKETEAKLVDAMYRARTTTNAPNFSGPQSLDAISEGNMVEVFEKSWESQQEFLRNETGNFLNQDQQAAFEEYQKQLKQMQLMGLKMAEKMMPGKKSPEN